MLAFLSCHGAVRLLPLYSNRIAVPLCNRVQQVHNYRRFSATLTPAPKPTLPTEKGLGTSPSPKENNTLRLLWDSECPLCVKEVEWLRRRALKRDACIEFVDIAQLDYDPQQTANVRIEYEQAMRRIHAVRSDGTVLEGIEAFREVYDRIGMGFIYSFTKVPILGALADYAYNFWADRRLSWTGRPSLQEIIRQRQKRTCR